MALQVKTENPNADTTQAFGAGSSANGKHEGRISVLFLTTSLEIGGAEIMLCMLIEGMDKTRFSAQVVSLMDLDGVSLAEKIRKLGVPLRSLGMSPGRPNPMAVLRLAQWLREDRPDVISTWMYHADLVGGLAAKLAGGIPVAWGVHQSDLRPKGDSRLTIYTAQICARLSRWLPRRIVCCSEASRQVHTALGYEAEKMVVIPNGCDLANFRPDPAARESVRKELEIPAEAILIGSVSRFHPQKDHRNLVQAAGLLHRSHADAHFVLCGDNVTWENVQLTGWIREAGIQKRCHLLGRRHDMPRLTAAFDIASTSSSYGEAFPLVIGEAMGCEIPCVVTAVGDSALIVGDTGRVVPPNNSAALAQAWRELVELGGEGRSRLGAAARHRIREHFDLPDIVERYQNVYQELAVGARVSRA
jgi:glycosyltransferase involved in cell wall biosynthesis